MLISTDSIPSFRSCVSRETFDRLEEYQSLLLKWNTRINLISRGSESQIWQRHILNSAQLWNLRGSERETWTDLGSGAGFPALVLAIIAMGEHRSTKFHLVESDSRKCAFLSQAATSLNLPVTIANERIEHAKSSSPQILSARALAPLPRLLELAENHRPEDGICLFPKGRGVHKELENAAANWKFDHKLHRSSTDPEGVILEIGVFERV